MSLELAIIENTRTLQQLIAVLRDQAANPVPVAENSSEIAAPAAEDPPKTKRTKKEAKPEAPAGEPEQSAPSPAAGAPDAPETAGAATATEPTYAEAAEAVTALINANGRAAAVALLKRFGAANLKQVDPSQYAALIAAAKDEAVPF